VVPAEASGGHPPSVAAALTRDNRTDTPEGAVTDGTDTGGHDPTAAIVYIGPGFAREARVKITEKATRVELRTLGADPTRSALARAAVDLAKRLDEHPGDRAAAMLCRELRLVMGDLHRRNPEDLSGEVEQYLERIAAPDGGDAAD
jgi:hypothetical protein